jgi:pyridoxine 5-phosphate synthase
MLPVMREFSVNVDHIATLRQARRENFPDPVQFALVAESAGADGVTCHLRSDRRHIQDKDVADLKASISGELNVEMAATDEMIDVVLAIKPHQISLVPERPEEVTTEGGLDLSSRFDKVKPYAERIVDAGVRLSVFIEAEEEKITLAKELGASRVEFNTDAYARGTYTRTPSGQGLTLGVRKNPIGHSHNNHASQGNNTRNTYPHNPGEVDRFIELFQRMARYAESLGLEAHVGHGLDYRNIPALAGIAEISGASIGFAIVARALEVGMKQAVTEMAVLMGKKIS